MHTDQSRPKIQRQTNLFFPLTLPLSVVFAVSLILHKAIDFDGFFINLSTEILGIFVTVFCVDYILNLHEQKKWAEFDERIQERLRTLLNTTITRIRIALGFGLEVLDLRIDLLGDKIAMHQDVIEVGVRTIAPLAATRIKSMDSNGWKNLIQTSNDSIADIDRFLTLYPTRLSPVLASTLLDLQEELQKATSYYALFPEVASIEKGDMTITHDPEQFNSIYFALEHTAESISRVCLIAKEVSILFNPVALKQSVINE